MVKQMDKFKIGVTCALHAPTGAPFPLVDPNIYGTIDFLADNGFDSIELHLRKPDEVDGYRILNYCEKKGILISSIGTGMAYGEGLSITAADPLVRGAAIQRLKEQLDLASVLECPIVVGSIRGKIGSDSDFNTVNERMIESCKELCEYAEKGNGSIVVEAIDRIETDYLPTAQSVLQLIEAVGSDKLMVHLDTYHMNMEERDWREPVLSCGNKLRHIHVADNTRHYPGYGLIDFLPFLKALRDIRYAHTLTMECYPGENGRETVLKGLAYLRGLESKVFTVEKED